MANKTVLKKESTKESKPSVKLINKKKQKTPQKKSSALLAGDVGRSAVNQVKANSSKDIKGSSGLANTGTNISYE